MEYALMLVVMAVSAVLAYTALAKVAQDSVTAGSEGLGELAGGAADDVGVGERQ
ncbi:MAG: hypothetical protein ACP5KN_07405 [Armatimonadota bacterium]